MFTLDNDFVEAMAYPLIFLEGEKGYSFKNHSKIINFKKYLCQRLLRPERTIEDDFLLAKNTKNEDIRVNRFNILSRVAQVFYIFILSFIFCIYCKNSFRCIALIWFQGVLIANLIL
jgi:hypothetical protein